MFKLDLSKFKKLSSDKDHTIMQHKAGHQIKIAHSVLSPKVKEQLDQLPHFDGGGSVPEPDPKKAKEFSKGVNAGDVSVGDAINNAKKALGFADGGPVQSMAQLQASAMGKPDPSKKPDTSTTQSPPTADAQSDADAGEQQTELVAYKKTHPGYADGGDVSDSTGSELAKLAPLLLAMAKGGVVKDPTQRNLLPGDKIPNAIEKQVINRAKYADGTPDAPVSQGNVPQAPNDDTGASFLQPKEAPDSPEQIQNDAEANAPTGPNAQYAPLYQNELDQIRKNNPGQPEIINQQMALDAAIKDKGALKVDNQLAINDQTNAHNAARVINNKKMELGLPPDQVPPSPQDQQRQPAASNLPQTIDQLNQATLQQQPPVQDPYGMNAAYDTWMTGMNQRLSGIQKEAAATGQLGTQQAGVLGEAVNTQKQFLSHAQDQYNQLNQERLHTLDDMDNNHIDPKHYVENMTTGDKVKTSIGLILGGFGALAGQGNMAYQNLQNNIARDIDAQKSNMGQRQNMLSNNVAQFGNLKDATQWQHAMSQDIIAYGLQQQAASMAPDMSKANALKLSGQLRQDSASMIAQMGMRRALMGSMQGAQSPQQFGQYLQMMRVMNPDMAKEMETRYVPNVGIAQVPVPQAVRDSILAKQQLDARAKDLYQWSSQHSGSLSPTDINVGQTKAAELQSMYRNAINGGVFKKGEQEFIDNIISSSPTSFFNNIRVLPRLKTVIGSNTAQLNQLKQSVGLPTPPGVGASGQYVPKTFKKAK